MCRQRDVFVSKVVPVVPQHSRIISPRSHFCQVTR